MSEARSNNTNFPMKSTKQLRTSSIVKSYQREWFQKMREGGIEGEPFGICSADIAEDIFTGFGMPAVVVPWWSSIIAAKRMSEHYGNLLNSRGYETMNYYGSLGLASTMDNNPETAPWGGLPKPAVVVGSAKQLQIWAREFGCPSFPIEISYWPPSRRAPEKWWESIEDHWDKLVEPHLLDYKVEELKELISLLEITTHRAFSIDKLSEVLALINEQEDYWRRARDLIAETVPCPVSLPDQLSMYPAQWFRGTPQGRDLIKGFYEEVKDRVEKGEAANPKEKLRLMWIGAGLWSNTAFYQYFEEQYGATFICTLYTSIAADCYRRTTLNNDPLRTLASRLVLFPISDASWIVHIAKKHKCNGLVALKRGSSLTCTTKVFHDFEKAGIPVLELAGDMVDARQWDDAKMRATVSEFIETRLLS